MNKLYEKDSYLKENTSVVSRCEKIENDYYISLEDTIFFPNEGGQYADTGVIEVNGRIIRILDGQIDGDSILYKVDSYVEPGSRANCKLDFFNRYDRMQNHSGEHLLTGVIHNKYAYDNKGFHLSDDGPVTLDISGPMTYEQVLEMEAEANRLIYANLPIKDSYPINEELKGIAYRSKIDILGQVRLITIGDEKETIDVCACCAPHLKSTGEIGIIKVTGVVNWKGGVRISMLAGRRAFEYISKEHELIKELTGILTTSSDNIIPLTKAHLNEIQELKSKLNICQEKAIITSIEEKIKLGNIGDNYFEFVNEALPQVILKNVYNYLTANFSGYVGIFAGNDKDGYRYLAGSANKDSRNIASLLRERLGVKGGGNALMVQGQALSTRDQLIDALEEME